MNYLSIVWGKVRRGKDRGRKLGFPTANIKLHKKIPEGIYVSITKIGESELPSVTFIGAAKTFSEKDIKAETFILDFDRDLYGKWITIKLIKKIRSNKTFSSVHELKEQMAKDIKQANEMLKLVQHDKIG